MVVLDVTPHFRQLVEQRSTQNGAQAQSQGQSQQAAQLLRSLAARTAFTKAANEIAHDITALRRFLRVNQYAYAQIGRMSEAEGDRLEGEIGSIVRACSANIQRLHSLLEEGAPAGDGTPDVAAHRAGAVLALSERLGATTAAYDRLRALRRQQEEQLAVLRRRRRAKPPACDGQAAPATASLAVAGGGHVAPSDPAIPGLPPDGHGGSDLRQRGARTPLSPLQAPPSRGFATLGHAEASTVLPSTASQRQQQVLKQRPAESAALHRELVELSGAVAQAEASVREVAGLNQAFSAAVAHQTGQIEALYAEAVRATGHIGAANMQLGKTVAAGKGAQRTLLVFMLLATLGLVFMDWWHS
uniref:SNARE-complex protein Syntaxin-18 N-terminal domain-containing protein n=3 Tax=Auxenochlorella protothecoides TaxID=3075 RepID=A0A1D1ZTJ1_AUXPR